MNAKSGSHAIVAITYEYTDPIDQLLTGLAANLADRGLRLTGFVQRDEPRHDRAKCDMILQELSSGETFRISEDRGKDARGCRLNIGWLLAASANVMTALDGRPDLLVINRFGKTEAEGGGLRHLIVRALEMDVPVLIAVPCRNLDSWRAFAEGVARELTFAEVAEKQSLIVDELLPWQERRRPTLTGSIPLA